MPKDLRGQHVSSVKELRDAKDKVFYVGRLHPRYLQGYASLRRGWCDVVLTSHRYNHYRRRHPEMDGYDHLLPSVVQHPDAVSISRYGRAKRVVYSQKYDAMRWRGRWHEVITFHFEKEGNINSRERRGLMLWRKEKPEIEEEIN